jgi:hypothetical protein
MNRAVMRSNVTLDARRSILATTAVLCSALLAGGSGGDLFAWPGRQAPGEQIDRIVAVVGGEIITLSDVRGCLALGLVEVDGPGDPVRLALEELIDRRLILNEVERYAPPEPDPAALHAAMERVQAGLGPGEGRPARLAAAGFDEGRLRAFLRDELRIRHYLDQRFAAVPQPSDQDLIQYFRQHEATFARDGLTSPFAAVREDVRARLVADRREQFVRDWIASLRRRSEISVRY